VSAYEHLQGELDRAESLLRSIAATVRLYAPNAIDAAHISRQREFGERTFGPAYKGVLDHLAKELDEVRAAPHDVSEWADVIILAIDGAWRAGHDPQSIIDAVHAKQAVNEARTWPDWRTAEPGKVIEHDRSAE
jgi:hypothetical protein